MRRPHARIATGADTCSPTIWSRRNARSAGGRATASVLRTAKQKRVKSREADFSQLKTPEISGVFFLPAARLQIPWGRSARCLQKNTKAGFPVKIMSDVRPYFVSDNFSIFRARIFQAIGYQWFARFVKKWKTYRTLFKVRDQADPLI